MMKIFKTSPTELELAQQEFAAMLAANPNPFRIVWSQTTAAALSIFNAASLDGTVGVVKTAGALTGTFYMFDKTSQSWNQITASAPTGTGQIQIGTGAGTAVVTITGGAVLSTTGVLTLSPTAVGAALNSYLGGNPLTIPANSSLQLAGVNTLSVAGTNVNFELDKVTALTTAGINAAGGQAVSPVFANNSVYVKNYMLQVNIPFTGTNGIQLGVTGTKNSLCYFPNYLLSQTGVIRSGDPGVTDTGLFTAFGQNTQLFAFSDGTATAGSATLRLEFDAQ